MKANTFIRRLAELVSTPKHPGALVSGYATLTDGELGKRWMYVLKVAEHDALKVEMRRRGMKLP